MSGDPSGARDAAVELCALAPDDLEILHKRFALEQILGDADGIAAAARALAPHNKHSPDLRAAVHAPLARVSTART